MLTARICIFDGPKVICQGQPQKVEELYEGRNVLRVGQIVKLSYQMLLAITDNDDGIHMLFVKDTGEVQNDIVFQEVTELEVEKLVSILSVNYNERYMGISTKGKLIGTYRSIYHREEEEDIVGENEEMQLEILASVYDRP